MGLFISFVNSSPFRFLCMAKSLSVLKKRFTFVNGMFRRKEMTLSLISANGDDSRTIALCASSISCDGVLGRKIRGRTVIWGESTCFSWTMQ